MFDVSANGEATGQPRDFDTKKVNKIVEGILLLDLEIGKTYPVVPLVLSSLGLML